MRGREEGKEEWKEQRNGGRKIAYSWRQVEQLQHGRKKGGGGGRKGGKEEGKETSYEDLVHRARQAGYNTDLVTVEVGA